MTIWPNPANPLPERHMIFERSLTSLKPSAKFVKVVIPCSLLFSVKTAKYKA